MELTERTRAILDILLEENRLQTAGEIAERLDVSSKTISRELSKVEEALLPYGVVLAKKKGAGISIRGEAEDIQKLKDDLGGIHKQSYTLAERRSIIVSRLLPSREPVKLFALSSLLKVTDGTISNDLDKLEKWFQRYGLRLVRKPGLGVYVEGEEQSIRKAIVAYIYDHMDENELLSLVRVNLDEGERSEAVEKASSYLLDLVDREIIHRLRRLVHQAETQLDRRLSDEAFIGLIVHLALGVQRIRKKEKIQIQEHVLKELRQKPEFQVADWLGSHIAEEFNLVVSEDEVGYITMHLLGARSRYKNQRLSGNMVDNFHLVRLAKSIMKVAEEETGQQVYRNQKLLAGLVNHLGPSISRLKLHMDIRNPLLTEMQERFPDLMELAHKCVREMERELKQKLPDSEIAYIAMHLSAALTDMELVKKLEHRIIVACPTGMGTSRLLASRIRKLYENLCIVDLVSTLQITEQYLEQQEIELIIATVPIPRVSIPVVTVSAVLGTEDREAIDHELLKLNERAAGLRLKKKKANVDFHDALVRMGAYNKAIQDLLDGFFAEEYREAMNVQQVADRLGRIIGRSAEQSKGIADALISREGKGGTAIKGSSMILLHCRSQYVQKLQFGLIQLGEYFFYPMDPGEKIRTAIVMLAPEESSCYELETIGYISAILLERWGLIEILHEGNRTRIYEELLQIFRGFYQKKYQELMEG